MSPRLEPPARSRAALARLGLRCAAWAALLGPVSIVLHELGHYLAGLALGYPMQLHAASVTGSPELAQIVRPPEWDIAAIALAGPLVTIVLVLVAVHFWHRSRERDWAFALAAIAPLRMLVGATYVLHVLIVVVGNVRAESRPNFDEYVAATALGIPPFPVVLVQTLLLLALWTWLVRSAPRGTRLVRIVGVAVGTAVGFAAWFGVLGPALLG